MDPLNDPRFPNRPQHPDFWSITDVVNQLDGRATEQKQPLPQILTELVGVDSTSLIYMAEQRAKQAVELLHLNPRTEAALASVFINAFSAGALFERKKHVPAPLPVDDGPGRPIRTQADMKAAIDEMDVEVEMMLLNHPTWVVVQWDGKDKHEEAPTVYGPFQGQTEAMAQRDRHHRLAMENWLPALREANGDPITHMAPLWPAEED